MEAANHETSEKESEAEVENSQVQEPEPQKGMTVIEARNNPQKYILELHTNGESVRRIVNILKTGKIINPHTGRNVWSKSAIDRVIQNARKEGVYDIRECLDKTPQSEKQKQAFAQVRAKHTCSNCGRTGITPSSEGLCPRCQKRRNKERAFVRRMNREHNNAILWAQELLETGFVILDTETTGLDSDARIVEIAIIDGVWGTVLVDTLVYPGVPIPPEASAIHGILDQDVQGKPTFEEICADVEAALSGKTCVIYNVAYDRPLLGTHDIETVNYDFDCAMEMYAQFYGQWSDYWKSFRWQSLTAAVDQCDLHISGTAHRTLGDCQATRAVIAYMAKQELKEENT